MTCALGMPHGVCSALVHMAKNRCWPGRGVCGRSSGHAWPMKFMSGTKFMCEGGVRVCGFHASLGSTSHTLSPACLAMWTSMCWPGTPTRSIPTCSSSRGGRRRSSLNVCVDHFMHGSACLHLGMCLGFRLSSCFRVHLTLFSCFC